MINTSNFINEKIARGQEAINKVNAEFKTLSFEQINWKPSPETWSIGECLEHLIIGDSLYFPRLELITTKQYKMPIWARLSPFSKMLGKSMINQLQAEVKAKIKSPRKFQPSESNKPVSIINEYQENLEKFLKFMDNCRSINIRKIIINSPSLPIITYSLYDAFHFLMEHEHRHVNQAIRVKNNDHFPSS